MLLRYGMEVGKQSQEGYVIQENTLFLLCLKTSIGKEKGMER